MVEGSDDGAGVGRVNEHGSTYGDVELVEPNRHVHSAFRMHSKPPNAVPILHGPSAVLHGIQGHVVFHTEAPRRLLVAVRHIVLRAKGFEVQRGKFDGTRAGSFMPGRAAVGDLGLRDNADGGQANGPQQGVEAIHGGGFNGRYTAGLCPSRPTARPWFRVGFRGKTSRTRPRCPKPGPDMGRLKNDGPSAGVAWEAGF